MDTGGAGRRAWRSCPHSPSAASLPGAQRGAANLLGVGARNPVGDHNLIGSAAQTALAELDFGEGGGEVGGGAGGSDEVGLLRGKMDALAKQVMRLAFMSHKVFLKSFLQKSTPHESVILSHTITNIKNEVTNV